MVNFYSRYFSMAVLLMWSCCFSFHAQAASHNPTMPTHDNRVASDNALPPLPAGVSEISFNEFFKLPFGPGGFEPTEKLLSLHNKRVRIVGFMAQEEDPTPGLFMVAARTIKVSEKADGAADDLPAATVFVHMPEQDKNKVLAFRPAPWVLVGTLQLGNQEEPNGRMSFVRLIMDK